MKLIAVFASLALLLALGYVMIHGAIAGLEWPIWACVLYVLIVCIWSWWVHKLYGD